MGINERRDLKKTHNVFDSKESAERTLDPD